MSDVLSVVEQRQGELREISFEVLTAGSELASISDGHHHVAIAGDEISPLADQLERQGVDHLHVIETSTGSNHGVYTQSINALIAQIGVEYIIGPNTVDGLDYIPAVATSQDMALVTDVTGFSIEGDNFVAEREMYSSKVETAVEVSAEEYAITIREGAWPPTEEQANVERSTFEPTIDESKINSKVLGYEEVAAGDVDISAADFLIGIGRGIEDEENLELIEELAEQFGAEIAATRPVIDNGWLPQGRQVGQSGKSVAPDVYLAIGISGAVQHVTGIRDAKSIIAINNDPNAPIFDIADYAIVGDLFDVVPEMVEDLS